MNNSKKPALRGPYRLPEGTKHAYFIWKPWDQWYYAGPRVPCGVCYGAGPSACHWLVPGTIPEGY